MEAFFQSLVGRRTFGKMHKALFIYGQVVVGYEGFKAILNNFLFDFGLVVKIITFTCTLI